jgi:hypothetical protein
MTPSHGRRSTRWWCGATRPCTPRVLAQGQPGGGRGPAGAAVLAGRRRQQPVGGRGRGRRAGAEPQVGGGRAGQDHQERWRLATHGGRSPIRLWPLHWPRHGRRTSGNVPLLSAPAAFAVPAAFGVTQPLPTVPTDATQPGLGHSGLLVGEPFRLGQGHSTPSRGSRCGEHPAAAARLPRP